MEQIKPRATYTKRKTNIVNKPAGARTAAAAAMSVEETNRTHGHLLHEV